MLEKDIDDKYPLFRVNISVTVQFQAMIEQFGLTQHVDESTRGWVDVILTRYGCSLFDLCFHPPIILIMALSLLPYTVSSRRAVLSCQTNPMLAESRLGCVPFGAIVYYSA